MQQEEELLRTSEAAPCLILGRDLGVKRSDVLLETDNAF
jgi:hypothetical protein